MVATVVTALVVVAAVLTAAWWTVRQTRRQHDQLYGAVNRVHALAEIPADTGPTDRVLAQLQNLAGRIAGDNTAVTLRLDTLDVRHADLAATVAQLAAETRAAVAETRALAEATREMANATSQMADTLTTPLPEIELAEVETLDLAPVVERIDALAAQTASQHAEALGVIDDAFVRALAAAVAPPAPPARIDTGEAVIDLTPIPLVADIAEPTEPPAELRDLLPDQVYRLVSPRWPTFQAFAAANHDQVHALLTENGADTTPAQIAAWTVQAAYLANGNVDDWTRYTALAAR